MKVIIETFDKSYPMIAQDKDGCPILFDDNEKIPQKVLDNYQKPVIINYE